MSNAYFATIDPATLHRVSGGNAPAQGKDPARKVNPRAMPSQGKDPARKVNPRAPELLINGQPGTQGLPGVFDEAVR